MPRFLFMAKTKTKTKTKAEAADIAVLRTKITDLVARNAIAMVQCAIDGVKEEGQFQAIKYLFEMVGLYPATAGAESDSAQPLAQILLQHLGLEDGPDATPKG